MTSAAGGAVGGNLHRVHDTSPAYTAPYSAENVLPPPVTALSALTAPWSGTALLPVRKPHKPLHLFFLAYIVVASIRVVLRGQKH